MFGDIIGDKRPGRGDGSFGLLLLLLVTAVPPVSALVNRGVVLTMEGLVTTGEALTMEELVTTGEVLTLEGLVTTGVVMEELD